MHSDFPVSCMDLWKSINLLGKWQETGRKIQFLH